MHLIHFKTCTCFPLLFCIKLEADKVANALEIKSPFWAVALAQWFHSMSRKGKDPSSIPGTKKTVISGAAGFSLH